MSKATEQLKGFLQEYYIENPSMGSNDMTTAARDLIFFMLAMRWALTFNFA